MTCRNIWPRGRGGCHSCHGSERGSLWRSTCRFERIMHYQRHCAAAAARRQAIQPHRRADDDRALLYRKSAHRRQPREDAARSRAVALSMVPTTTSAHRLLGQVLPHLAGRIEARALRVPTASVSAIDLTVALKTQRDISSIRDVFKRHCETSYVLGWIESLSFQWACTDARNAHRQRSPAFHVRDRRALRIFGWYDNEWGFANRMLDMALLVGRRTQEDRQ